MGEIREPIKRTSIEKKKKIIEKGFELMCEEGYHNVTCVDIAKYADVSTGAIYQYFTDKRDIFLEGVKNYADKIMFPMLDILENKTIKIENISEIVSQIIDYFINVHTMSQKSHEQLMAMSHLDEDVGALFNQSEMEMTKKIAKLLEINNIKVPKENIHIAFGIVDNFCHEIVYHKHKELDYETMKEKVIQIVALLIK